MRDFWHSSGHLLTDRDAAGRLVATDAFLKAYLARPEVLPPWDSCAGERRLHAALLADPRRPVEASEIAAIAAPEARENWSVLRTFRDHLLRHPTLEAAYLDAVRGGPGGLGGMPPLFLNQLVHVILRNALDGCEDVFVLRAAEILFRPQRVALWQGATIAADEEAVAAAGGEIDILSEDDPAAYWERSELFDLGLDLTAGRRGGAALATVIATWLRHMMSLDAAVEPLSELRDARLTWYIGLDAEGTRIGDALWRGDPIDEETRDRLVALFRLTLGAASEAIYLILAMTPDRVLRMKPQNLLTGLPAGAS